DPLGPASAAALADAILWPADELAALKRRLVAHTAGNAFFMEEIVQALVETHALAGERGQYRLGRLVEGLQIPDRVQAVLAARIDRLSGESKAVLQAGAAIGVDVPVALLQAVANASSEDALRALAHLPESRDTFAVAIDLRLDLRVPLLQLGRLDDLHRLSKEAESMAQHVGDEERLARAYSYLVNYHYLLGEPARADEYGARLPAIARRRREPAPATLGRSSPTPMPPPQATPRPALRA